MRRGTGRRLAVLGILGALYLAFVLWHDGSHRPLSAAEIDAYMTSIARNHAGVSQVTAETLTRFRRFAESDDGESFYMANLLRYRQATAYPPGKDPGGSVRDANARYARAVVPLLLKRGSYPVARVQPSAALFDAGEGTGPWDEVAVVRYRSRRDFLEMVSSPEYADGEVHKWAALKDTVVMPSRGMVLPGLKLAMLMLLSVLGIIGIGVEQLVDLIVQRHGEG